MSPYIHMFAWLLFADSCAALYSDTCNMKTDNAMFDMEVEVRHKWKHLKMFPHRNEQDMWKHEELSLPRYTKILSTTVICS
jgi:hypothetical protein